MKYRMWFVTLGLLLGCSDEQPHNDRADAALLADAALDAAGDVAQDVGESRDADGADAQLPPDAAADAGLDAQPDTSPSVEAADYYVAADGDDAASGGETDPFATIEKAIAAAQPGDLIYVRGGTYDIDHMIRIEKSGEEGNPIRLFGYPGERPVLDFSSFSSPGRIREAVRLQDASWWHLKNLHVTRGPWTGVALHGSSAHNILENVESSHHGRQAEWLATGFVLDHESHHNRLLNCDSHHNANLQGGSKYGNGDGIAVISDGEGNELIGCRMWNNGDDGVDLYWAESPVLIERCWSYRNGYDDAQGTISGTPNGPLGDGNGYKLGGEANREPWTGPTAHVVRYSAAWSNAERGFDENVNGGAIELYNNIAWNNGSVGWRFQWGEPAVMRNNVGFQNSGRWLDSADESHNSWNDSLGVEVTKADFLSLDDSIAAGPRQADGSLPDSDFLKLAADSDLVDAGVDVGLPFNGNAPDLGAFESR